MQRYALISGARVDTVVVQATVPTVQGTWVACPDWVGPGDTWDGTFFQKYVPVDVKHITSYAFKSRMTSNERIAIRAAAQTNPVVYDFLDLADSARYIDLSLPSTRSGVQSLEAAGLLAAGRAAQILDLPIQQFERP